MHVQRLTWHPLPLAKVPGVIKVFFCVDILLCLLYLADNLLGNPVHDISVLLDLNGERSLGAWYSSKQLFCIALLSLIFCYAKLRSDKKTLPLMCLPMLFFAMSIDESLQIHEWLGDQADILIAGSYRTGTDFKSTGYWMFFIGLPFILMFALYVNSIKSHFQANLASFEKLLLGMGVLLTGSIGVEISANFINPNLLFIECFFEEGLEMIGATIMLWAAYDLAIEAIANNPSLLPRQS